MDSKLGELGILRGNYYCRQQQQLSLNADRWSHDQTTNAPSVNKCANCQQMSQL